MNVAIYVRVSTQEQKLHGISVGAQEATCRSWVEEQGHHLVNVYNDAGLSARARYSKRRAMLQLLDDVKAEKIDLVIFTKLDRWFRNVADYYEVQAILEAHNVKWRAIQEDYETETASGRFKVNIMLAVAQDEADRTSERIKAAADYKRTKGEAVGRPALGYKIENKHWVIDPETHDGVAAFFETYLRTLSIREAMLTASEYGIIHNQTHALRVLRNPTYMGDAFGVPCPAYITKEQYMTIRRQAEKRTRTNRSGRVFIFTGLLRCGCCGGAMTSASMRKAGHEIKYYHCQNHAQYLDRCPSGAYANEAKIEQYLRENLSSILADYKIHSESGSVKQKKKSASAIRGKLERLRELYIDGEIDRSTYDTKSAPLKQELENAETPAPPSAALEIPDDWLKAYDALTDEYKKVFWRKVLRRIVIKKDQPPLIEF